MIKINGGEETNLRHNKEEKEILMMSPLVGKGRKGSVNGV